jgi:hypothetical protein
MKETEMGYRGSKSEIKNPQPPCCCGAGNRNITSVKEQRVDGSYCIKSTIMQLRCTLMDGASCYPFKIPSKQLNNRSFSTLNSITETELNP